MRGLIIDEAAKAKIARVREYARQPEHFYDALGGADGRVRIPGNDGNLQAHLDTFRCVFSYTKAEGKIWRHLSISVSGGKYPNAFAAFTIADLFGFTGWGQKTEGPPSDWFCAPNMDDRCVVLAQPLKDGEVPT